MTHLHSARPAEVDATTMYRILKLRVDVFVVEQNCPYPELDGRDLEPDAWWFWANDESGVIATLRLLTDSGSVRRIGRVVTAPAARSTGVAGRLMTAALTLCGGSRVVLDAQSHLAGWYARFGFVSDGEEFVEDGIPHIPMARPAIV